MRTANDTPDQKVAWDIMDMSDRLFADRRKNNPDVVQAFLLGYEGALYDLSEEISKKYKLRQKHK
jgi:hypothetical protein